jgi:hypothetical protein
MLSQVGKVGQRVTLEYPVCNRVGVPLEFLKRKIEIESVRSIADEPLSLQSFLMRPFLRRGVHLIEGRENGERRRFYKECCKDEQDAGLQYVLVDDDEPNEFVEPFSRVFWPTLTDRRIMLATLDSYEPLPLGFHLAVRAVKPLVNRINGSFEPIILY